MEEASMTEVGSENVDQAVEAKASIDEQDEACRKISETSDKVRAEFQSQDEIRNELLATENALAKLKPFLDAVQKIEILLHARKEHETAVGAKGGIMLLSPSAPTVSGEPSMKAELTVDLKTVRKHQQNVHKCISTKCTDKPVQVSTGVKPARYCCGRRIITAVRKRLFTAENFFGQSSDKIKPPLTVGTDQTVCNSSASLESISPREGTSRVQTVRNVTSSIIRSQMLVIQEIMKKIALSRPASRHIDQPTDDLEELEKKFFTALNLTETEEQEHARTGNQTALSSGDNKTDASQKNDAVENKPSDTVLQEKMKMKRYLRKIVAEGQQENMESAINDMISSFLSIRIGDDSDIDIPKEKPAKRVAMKEIDQDDLLPSKRSKNEIQNVKPETGKGPAPLKSALKKTSSGQSANGATQRGVLKLVRFAPESDD